MKTFLIITFILLLTNISCDSFTATLSNSQTLTSGVTYVFNITFGSRTIGASSTATLTFTLNYNINSSSLTNCMFATTNSVSYSSTTCSVSTNSSGYFVLFNSIYPAQLTSETLLSLRLQMANPWGAGSENINSVIMDSVGTNLTLRQTVSVPYTASPLNSCQWLSNSTVNGASSSRTISFIPSVQLIQTSYLQVTIPLWFQTTSNVIGSSITCGSVSNVDFTPTCSYTTIGSTEVYTFSSLFSSNKTVSSAVQLSLSTLYNPWSTFPFSPISFLLYNTQNGATKISQSCSGISQTTSTLNTFNVFTVSGTFTTINTVNTNRVIQFNTKNPILQSGAQLKLSWSGGVTATYTVQTNIVVVSQNSSDIIISNFTASNILSSSTRFLFGWNFVNPPSSRPFYITLTSMYNTGGTSYGIDTMTNTYSCTPGAITTYSLSASTYAINAVTAYTIRFTTIYPLRSGSFIGIVFPSYISLVLGSSCSSTNSFLSCSVANTSYANISISGTVSASTSLTLTFNSVTNPNQAMTTGSLLIYTYYDSGLDSVVDRLISGMTFTSIANLLTSDVYVVPSSFTTYTASNYIFSVQMTDIILAAGYISIVFPSTFTLGTVTLLSASFPTSTCVVSLSGYTVSINSCFSSNYATLAITFTLGGITNPNSFQPTSSFSISTFGPIGMINYITSGLSVTMTTAAVATSFSLVPSDFTVHASTVYTLSTTFFMPHSANDYMLLTIPASMQFSSTPSCSGQQGIALVACTVPNTTTLKLAMTTVPSTSIQLTINSIRNYDVSSSSISFVCYIYNSGNYLMESTPASTVTYTPTAIISFSVASNNQIILNQASTISITLSTPFSLDSSFSSTLTKLLLTIPSQFTTLGSTSCSSTVGSSCTLLNSTTFSIVAPGLSITSAVVSMMNVKLPQLSAASTSFSIQYVYNNLQVATVSSGVTVSAYCSSPCQQCSSSPSICLSCLPAPNNYTIYYSTNNSCVNVCPSGTFASNSTCVACISPCGTCTTATLCLSCTNGTTFYAANSSCLSACPSGYYNDSNGNCSICVSPCSTCTTATFCLSCSIDFLSNNTCVNSSSCPTGTYANSTSHSCDACQSPCSACSLSQINCTTCITSYLFYNNTCFSSCPQAMYSNTTSCLSCISPCFNCSSPSFCLSCISTYLYNGTCYNDTACPAGTFANTSTLKCDACAINCSTCSILSTNCTACSPPYFYFNGSCVNTCPTGMFQNGTVCENCFSPCYKCSSVTICLSCSYNYFTNFTCVNASQCPTGTFANLTALNCDSCSFNCTTCSLASTNCTSCTAPNFYYNSSCVSSCPFGFFQNSTVCQVCVSPCLTCTSVTLCLSCMIDYYNHNFTCVNASACPTGTFPNATAHNCDFCSNNCTTCSLLPTNCTSCSSPLFLYNDSCVGSCPSGMFQNGTLCQACVSPCLTCTGVTVCLSCSTNFYTNFTCVAAALCPSGTFGNISSLRCDPCSNNCTTCSALSNNCTSCSSPLFLYNESCVGSCPSGMFQNGTLCQACIAPCLTCTGVTVCLSCSTNFYTNSTCVIASLCPSGTFGNTSSLRCDPCSNNCTTCSALSNNCTSCSSPNFYYNSSCISSCPPGYFQNSTVCQVCVSPCLTCTSVTLCLSCMIDYYNHNFTCVNASACPTGTFPNATAHNCDFCSNNCTTCSLLPTNCTSCSSPLFLYNDSCVGSCPSGMFQNGTLCQACVSPCLTCTGVTVCLSCSTNFYTNFTCVATALCPSGTFGNISSLRCDPCSNNCTTCSALSNNCTSCSSPLFLYNESCVGSCPSGMFQNGTLCQACIAPCLTCTGVTVCLSCSTNFYTNSTCVIASLCPSGTFGNTSSLRCDPCSNNCTTCSALSNNCTSCNSSLGYYNGTCLSACPSGMYNSANVCTICVSPCFTCSSATICIACSGMYYTNQTCVNASLCPAGTFANGTSFVCDPCSNNCSTCSSSASNCTSCTLPNAYSNFQCVSSCPVGAFQNGTICVNCSLPCTQCTSPTACVTCTTGYFYFNQSCLNITSCPSGTYANSTLLNCSACISPCVSCHSSPNNCTSCVSSLIYTSNQCVSSCPALMYNSSGVCANCSFPCGNCTSSTLCLTCTSGYLTNNSCVNSSSCPSGTYAESSNNTCSSCVSPCANCYTIANCSTCANTFYYYNFTCLSTCPNGTFQNTSTCSFCDSTCLTCSISSANCTSCPSTLNLFKNTCVGGCPTGTYNTSSTCTNCSSTCYSCSNFSVCTSCNGSLLLTNSQCLSSCPNGTFADLVNNQCLNCSSSCLTCTYSQSSCTSCPSNLLFTSNSCQATCPSNYFNVSGICTTCSNCNTCTNATTCFICATGYYLYAGVCYSTCPPAAPIKDTVTSTCSLCGSTCTSCSADGTFCFTCATNYLLLSGVCYTSCPSGYTADSTNTKCTAVKTASIVYFPFSISLLCISFIAIFSKAKYAHSDLIGNLTALAAFAFLFSIMIFTIPAYTSNSSRLLATSSISSNTLIFLLGVGIAVVVVLFIIGLFFNIYVFRKFQKDSGLLLWKKNSKVNRFMYGLITFFSCFHFAIFRFLYSKLFLRQCFSCYIKAHKRLLFVTNILTFITILLANVPSIALSTYMIIKQEGTTQDQISAVDNLIITALLSILLLLDMGSRGPEDFQTMLEDFPYLKKTKKYQDLDSSSGSLISIHQSEEEQHCKTQADVSGATKLKAINIEDQLGNFGAIDQIQDESQSRVMKTQPQYSKMTGDISFNPFELKKINDDLFFQEKEYTKKFNEIKEDYAKGIFEEEVMDDDGITHQNQDLFREPINVQEMINQRKRQIDPQEFLNKFRSEDYDNITEEDMAILMEMAEQKGLDPAFIKETFGKNKFYNKKILEELIGDHEQISNESAQALLSQVNSQSKLRQVLGQKSNINVDKLVDILNDPQYKEIIEAMFNKETGFLSIDAIKDLLADNKKYSKDFIIKLLNNQTIDKTRLKMLLESNKQGELDALKTIKQLGGDNLENDERMSNLLGKESPLNPTLIPKIKKEMSNQSTSNIFDKKSQANTTMIKRVINNKRIKLDELNPIQEMPEIIEEFAELLNCGNEDMQENLIELLQTNNYDGNKLKELIENSGSSQEEMAKFLQYVKQNKEANQFRDQTPVENWDQNEEQSGEEEDQEDKQSSLPSLNFSLNDGFNEQKTEANKQFLQNNNNNDESFMQPYDTQSKLRRRTKYRKKEPNPIHLPSQEIYLQRLQAPHEVQKNKKFRKAKKKAGKMPNKFMDEDNEVYDLDF